jgi:hypothetical protein
MIKGYRKKIFLYRIESLRNIVNEIVIFYGINEKTNYCNVNGKYVYGILNDIEYFLKDK